MRFPRVSPLRALGGLVLGILVGVGGYALSQQVGFTSLAGSETVEVQLGIGGSSAFVTTGRMTSGRSYAYFTTFPTTFTIGQVGGGTTVSTAGMANGGALLINAAAAGTTVYTFPPNPVVDGTVIAFCNATAVTWAGTANTVAANTGQSLIGGAALTTLPSSSCARYLWNLGAATWFLVSTI